MKIVLIVALMLFTSCRGINALNKSELTVIKDRCTSCKQCIHVCNSAAIAIVNGVAVIDPSKCTECGKCVEVCPNDAIY